MRATCCAIKDLRNAELVKAAHPSSQQLVYRHEHLPGWSEVWMLLHSNHGRRRTKSFAYHNCKIMLPGLGGSDLLLKSGLGEEQFHHLNLLKCQSYGRTGID